MGCCFSSIRIPAGLSLQTLAAPDVLIFQSVLSQVMQHYTQSKQNDTKATVALSGWLGHAVLERQIREWEVEGGWIHPKAALHGASQEHRVGPWGHCGKTSSAWPIHVTRSKLVDSWLSVSASFGCVRLIFRLTILVVDNTLWPQRALASRRYSRSKRACCFSKIMPRRCSFDWRKCIPLPSGMLWECLQCSLLLASSAPFLNQLDYGFQAPPFDWRQSCGETWFNTILFSLDWQFCGHRVPQISSTLGPLWSKDLWRPRGGLGLQHEHAPRRQKENIPAVWLGLFFVQEQHPASVHFELQKM